ncbi:LysM peptidoglycan-binding domain-containing protein [Vagococcus salmoninarum]|uniref:Peptidoglycan hydrolase n=1 Tax=Vagococcus salmoninarum TaxID=2739 RepID=A0A429ZSK2_9ENTE|nr:LysM peptidoglycan-binding domain-containing protein [Vagococcus salmoninarum]RST96599.1 hypothetical protein CBF35_05045 [Vagococcus salmoninarum]
MNEKDARRKTLKLPKPLQKGASFFGTTMLISSTVFPAATVKVLAETVPETKQESSNNEIIENSSQNEQNQASTEGSGTNDSLDTDNSVNEQVEESTEELPIATSEEVLPENSTAETLDENLDPIEEVVTEQVMPQLFAARSMRSMAPSTFIQQISSQAKTVANANDLYASVMIAQAILESSWGNSALSLPPNHNLFGIKGQYNGQSVSMKTQEEVNGSMITITAQFRKYPSYSESLNDNARVLKTTSFQQGVYFYAGAWKSNTKSYRDATAWLTGRYATDSNYASKLNNLIVNYNLTQYDTPGSGTGTLPPNSGGNTTPPSNATTHTVVSGDTLSGIASRYGVTVANLKSWNNLKNDLIIVGQRLQVKAPANQPSQPKPPTTPPSNTTTHTVVSGDTLSGIASRYKVTIGNLKSWNNLKSDLIIVGQRLQVKAPANQPSQPKPPTTPSNTTTHTVVSGDTLSRIASRYKVTVGNLKSWNNLKSDLIIVGQRLQVKGTSSPSQPKPPTNAPSNTTTHTVVSGDTLSRIASRYKVTVGNLKSWNNLKSDLIIVGQRLQVKGTNSPSQPKPPTNAPSNTTTHAVVSGDTLSGIASRYGVSIANLKTWNGLKSDLIFVGQRLTVKGTTGGANTTPNKPNTNQGTSTYTVISGDTLSRISNHHNVSVANLKAWNNLKSDLIFVGQKLQVKQTSTPNKPAASNQKKYKVVSGDTLWSIAEKNNVTIKQLSTWNKLSGTIIYSGQVLRVK